MSNETTPGAIRLAEWIDEEIAAELRRMHAEIAALTAERDDLQKRLDAAEKQFPPPNEETVREQFRAYDGSGWANTATPWQIWRDAVKWAIHASSCGGEINVMPAPGDIVAYRILL